jgi:hypothetical protein
VSYRFFDNTKYSQVQEHFGNPTVSFYQRPVALRPAIARGLPLSGVYAHTSIRLLLDTPDFIVKQTHVFVDKDGKSILYA